MTGLLLSALLGAAAAQTPVPAPIDEPLARLADARYPQGQLAALEELTRRSGGLDWGDQRRVLQAMLSAADSSANAATVRGRSLMALARSQPWWTDSVTRAEAVQALADYARADGAMDGRVAIRPYALIALGEAAGRLPPGEALREAVAGAALDALRRASGTPERTAALGVLDAGLRAEGARFLLSSWDLRGRLEAEVLAPLEGGGLDRLYDDPQGTLEARYHLIRALAVLGRSANGPEPSPRHRCIGLLRAMSQRDPDPRLRQLAELYSRVPY